MGKTIFIAVVSVILMALPASVALAQGDIQIVSQSIESEFRDNIKAGISLKSGAEITEVEFFYRVAGQVATSRNVADFEPGTTVEAAFSINQTEIYFPPGTELEYWWKATDANGNSVKSDKQTYLYFDERYEFNILSNERVSLYWYSGSDKFGQALFDQANKGLDQLETNVNIVVEQPIKIFIYGNHNDLLNAIAVGAQEWTGGQAFAEFGVVVMGVSPGSLDWGLKATTHELTHLVIHQATDNPYGDLPRWLDEGLAVYNENPDRLDSQFRSSFKEAVSADRLMTLQTLSSSFPADPDAANLAYGESGAIVKFVIDTYGPEAMHTLLDIFSEGALYDKALQQALGVTMRELDNQWRESLGVPPLSAPEPAAGGETPAADSAQAEPAATSALVVASPAPPEKSSKNKPAGNLPCLAGALPLLFLTGLVWFKRPKSA